MITAFQVISILWILPVIFIEGLAILGVLLKKEIKKVKKETDIQFVIAAWKEGERVVKCVNSILAQNYPAGKVKVIIVGGGDENTVKLCAKLAKKRGVEFIHEKDRTGKWFALNTALKRVKTDHVAFTDADCILEKDWLRRMLSHDADIVISDFNSTSEKTLDGKIYGYGLYITSRLSEGVSVFFKSGEYMGIGSIVKSKVFEKVRFRKSFVEDWVFVNDAKKSGFSVEHSQAKTYQHIPSSVTDYRKALVKLMKGYFSTLDPAKDMLSLLVLLVSFLIVLSMPFYAYQLLRLDAFVIAVTAMLIFSTMAFTLAASLKEKKRRFVLYAPLILLIALVFGVAVTETVAMMLMRKEIEWEIYNKKEE